MLERQLSSVIAKHLSKFLRNLPEEQLSVSLWAGEVSLESVELQEDVFDQLSLLMWRASTEGNVGRAASAELASLLMPFTVVRGVVRRLRISLPWSALESEPVSVEVEGVDVVLAPLRHRPFSADEEERRRAAVKEVQLAALEADRAAEGSSAVGGATSNGGGGSGDPKRATAAAAAASSPNSTVTGLASSFVDRLVATILRNIQLTVRDVNVTFAFDYAGLHGSLASALALRVAEVAVVPTDDEWRPRFIRTTSVPQCRLVHVGGISLMGHVGRRPGGTWAASVPILEPFGAQLKVVTPAEVGDSSAASITVNAVVSAINANVTADVLKMLQGSVEAFTSALQYAPHRPFLPLLSEGGGSAARRRWRFAIAAVVSQLRQRHAEGRGMGHFLSVKAEYVGLTKRGWGAEWLPPLTAAEVARCAALEQSLSFDQIVSLKCLAKAELSVERRYVAGDKRRLHRQSAGEQPQPQAGAQAPAWRRWGAWWGGGGVAQTAVQSGAPTSPATSSPPSEAEAEAQPANESAEGQSPNPQLLMRRRIADALKKELRRVDVLAAAAPQTSSTTSGAPSPSPASPAPPQAADGGAPTARPIALTVELPRLSVRAASSDGAVGIVATLSGLAAASLIGEAGRDEGAAGRAMSRHPHQLEVGSFSIASLQSGRPIVSMPQTSSPCLSVGADAAASSVRAAIGIVSVFVPPAEESESLSLCFAEMVAAAAAGGGAPAAITSSAHAALHQQPARGGHHNDAAHVVAVSAASGGRRTVGRALSVRVALRRVAVFVPVPESSLAVCAEVCHLDCSVSMGASESGSEGAVVIIETVAGAAGADVASPNAAGPSMGVGPSGGCAAFVGARVAMVNTNANAPHALRPFAVEAVGLRLAAGAGAGSTDVACGAVTGHWGREALAPTARLLQSYRSLTLFSQQAAPSPVPIAPIAPAPTNISTGLTRVAVYSFEFALRGRAAGDGAVLTGVSGGAAGGGLTPWLYATAGGAGTELRCEGFLFAPDSAGWAHAATSLGALHLRQGADGSAFVTLHGARIAAAPLWAEIAEIATVLSLQDEGRASRPPSPAPVAVVAAQARVGPSPTLRVELAAPIVVSLVGEGEAAAGAPPLAEATVEALSAESAGADWRVECRLSAAVGGFGCFDAPLALSAAAREEDQVEADATISRGEGGPQRLTRISAALEGPLRYTHRHSQVMRAAASFGPSALSLRLARLGFVGGVGPDGALIYRARALPPTPITTPSVPRSLPPLLDVAVPSVTIVVLGEGAEGAACAAALTVVDCSVRGDVVFPFGGGGEVESSACAVVTVLRVGSLLLDEVPILSGLSVTALADAAELPPQLGGGDSPSAAAPAPHPLMARAEGGSHVTASVDTLHPIALTHGHYTTVLRALLSSVAAPPEPPLQVPASQEAICLPCESGEGAAEAEARAPLSPPFLFTFATAQALSLTVGAHDGRGAVCIAVDGLSLRMAAGAAVGGPEAPSLLASIGTLRVVDDSRRRLPLPSSPSATPSPPSPPLSLAPRMPIVTVAAVDAAVRGAMTSVRVDTVFVTLLADSVVLVARTLVPAAVAPLLQPPATPAPAPATPIPTQPPTPRPASGGFELAVRQASVYVCEGWAERVGAIRIAEVHVAVGRGADGATATRVAVRGLDVAAEPVAEGDAVSLVENGAEFALNISMTAPLQTPCDAAVPTPIAPAVPVPHGAVSVASSGLSLVVHPSLLRLAATASSQITPIVGLDLAASPELGPQQQQQHQQQGDAEVPLSVGAPVRHVPHLTLSVGPSALVFVQCLRGSHAPLRVEVGAVAASNALFRKVDGPFVMWSDVLTLRLTGITAPRAFPVSVPEEGVTVAIANPLPFATTRLDTGAWVSAADVLAASRPDSPVPTATAAGYAPYHSRVQSNASVGSSASAVAAPIGAVPMCTFEAATSVACAATVRVSRSTVAASLRIAALLATAVLPPPHAAGNPLPQQQQQPRARVRAAPRVSTVLRIAAGSSRVELIDEASGGDEVALVLSLPPQADVIVATDPSPSGPHDAAPQTETRAVLRGALTAGDAAGMALLRGPNAAVDVTAHPLNGTAVMLSGVSIILDLKRAHALVRAMTVASPLIEQLSVAGGGGGGESAAAEREGVASPSGAAAAATTATNAAHANGSAVVSPDVLHDTLATQQQSLRAAPPALRIGVQAVSIEIGHMARVAVGRASAVVQPSGDATVLVDEAAIEDRRAVVPTFAADSSPTAASSPRRVVTVSHVNVSSSVGDVKVTVHSAVIRNDALFFTDLASALVHAYRSVLPRLPAVPPQRNESFRQSASVDLRSCSIVFAASASECGEEGNGGEATTAVDVTFPGLVVKSTQSTEGVGLIIDAIDGSMGYIVGGARRQALCDGLRFRLETAASPLEESLRLAVGKVALAAPLGAPLRAIVAVMAENLTPYALWGRAMMRAGGPAALSAVNGGNGSASSGGAGDGTAVGVASPVAPNPATTRARSAQIDVPSVSVSLFEVAPDGGRLPVVSVRLSEVAFSSAASPDEERLELRVGSIVSETDKTIQPDFIRALPLCGAGGDRDATSNYGVFLRTQRSFDLSGSKGTSVVRWGSASLVLSPQLIRIVDENVLRPAGMGIREANAKKDAYALNESFTTASSEQRGGVGGGGAHAEEGLTVITADYTFTGDTIVGGADGVRLHIARRGAGAEGPTDDGSPNVIHLRAAEGATVHLYPSTVRPIVVDDGVSVYCNGIRFTTDASFGHILDYVHCGERSFFNVALGALHPRPSRDGSPEAEGSGTERSAAAAAAAIAATGSQPPSTYAVLSSGLRHQRQHSVAVSVRGRVSISLCNNRDAFSLGSDVEAEYSVSRRGAAIVEEKGFFGLPTLVVQCNDGAISKRPITVITHLEHRSAAPEEGRAATTSVHVIIDTTRIALTLGHAKLFHDTVGAVLPLASRAGRLGVDIDGMTTMAADADDPFRGARADPLVASCGHQPRHSSSSSSEQRLSIVVNAPSLLFEVLDASGRARIGYGGVEGLSVQLAGSRDLSTVAVKGSCSIRVVDMPFAHGGERVLLDVSPEVVIEAGTLSAGGSACEVAIAVPPLVANVPLLRAMAAASYEFRPPARGPYAIANDTDLRLRIDVGDATFDAEEFSSLHAPIEPGARVRLHLKELPAPVIVDLSAARSEIRLPSSLTLAGALIITVCHEARRVRLFTGVEVLSRLDGAADPLLAARWADAFGYARRLPCAPNAPSVIPFAAISKPLRLEAVPMASSGGAACPPSASEADLTEERAAEREGAEGRLGIGGGRSGAALPIDVLCGMARVAAAGRKRGMRPARFALPIGGGRSVAVLAVVEEAPLSAEFPCVTFEVSPMGALRNDSAFPLTILSGAAGEPSATSPALTPRKSEEGSQSSSPSRPPRETVLPPGARWSWFSAVPPTVRCRLATSDAPLLSDAVALPAAEQQPLSVAAAGGTQCVFVRMADSAGAAITARLSVCPADGAVAAASGGAKRPSSSPPIPRTGSIVAFSCGLVVRNCTPFGLEVTARGAATQREALVAGLCSGRGLQPQQCHPLGYGEGPKGGDATAPQSLRVRPVLPNVAASGLIAVGGASSATALTAGASCAQSDGAGKESVHVFAVSERAGEVRVSPMWTVANASGLPLSVLTGGVDITVPPRGAGGLTTFPFKDSADPLVRFAFEGYSPSAPLHLATASQRSTTNAHQCLLTPLGAGRPACLTLSVDRRSRRHINITATVSETNFPFLIENRTAAPLIAAQRGQTGKRLTVPPFCSSPFAFDSLTGVEKVIAFETVHTVTGRTVRHAVDPDMLPPAAEGWELGKGLFMTASASADRCTLSLVTDRLLHASYIHRPRGVTNVSLFMAGASITLSAPVGSARRTVLLEAAEGGAFGEGAAKDPAAFMARREFEIVCLRIADVSLQATDNGRHRLLTASIGEAEVLDVSWEGAKHRALISCARPKPKGVAAPSPSPSSSSSGTAPPDQRQLSAAVPWARLSLHQATADNAAMTVAHIVAMSAHIGGIRVSLNDRALHTLIAAAEVAAPPPQAQPQPQRLTSPPSPSPAHQAASPVAGDAVGGDEVAFHTAAPYSGDESGAPQPQLPNRLKIDRIFVSAVPVLLTYARRSDGRYDPFEGLPFRRFVTSLEGAPLTLSEVSAADYAVAAPEGSSTWGEVAAQLFVPVYRSSAVLQSYKLVGSLEVLGNPMLFTSTVREGLRDFFVATAALNPLEGMSQLLASTGSGLLHTCSLFSRVGGRLVGAATFDPQWLAECDQRSGRSVLRGLTQGAAGVFTRPIDGARSGGLTGALTGLLAGASGAIAKPVSGAFLTVASATEGAAIALRRGTAAGKRGETADGRSGGDGADGAPLSPLGNQKTAQAWIEAGEGVGTTPSASSTPTAGAADAPGVRPPLPKDRKTKASPAVVEAAVQRVGARQAALLVGWHDYVAHAPADAFASHGYTSRDAHLADRLLGPQRPLPSSTLAASSSSSSSGSASGQQDASAMERALHLRETLGVAGMLKYVTLDQFVRCVSWEEARRAVPIEEFRAKVAPMMVREMERGAEAMRWL